MFSLYWGFTWPSDSIGTIETQIAILHLFLEEQVVGKEEKLHQYAENRLEYLRQKLTEFQLQQLTELTPNVRDETGVVNAHATIARHIVQRHKALMVAIA